MLAGTRTSITPIGTAQFQYALDEAEDRWGIPFEHKTPSPILREIIEALLEDVLLKYQ